MTQFIDRRQNPKDKSLGNRQRFMRRARAQIKEVVNRSIKERNITDVASGETITIPTKGIGEPRLRHAQSGGVRERVFSGNKQFSTGDKIDKPPSGGGGRGKEGADSGDGEDSFEFALTREEFLDLFFEDLELPDMIKRALLEVKTWRRTRAGITTVGSPTNLNILRTMRQAHSRRIALRRPRTVAVETIEAEIAALEAKARRTTDEDKRLATLQAELERMGRRRRAIPYIDPLDLRFNAYQARPEPNAQAVMFCLMDVSGSMGEREKDLAKRFFILLHLFLRRRYDHVEVVFIRHTHEAQEVDEETFFYSRETGGTVVSTALAEMARIQKERYPVAKWNIYAAQASDGENHSGDADRCIALLDETLMPVCQYYAYVEILDEREIEIFRNAPDGTALWRAYRRVADSWGNFAMKRIARPADIYPVFRELFAPRKAGQPASRAPAP
ncbi:MAG: YeaH/YhbH family protein [Alphaproteobacteria bacterium]|nr:YeaH/YhbH family protein [Alphaproteobacteria bacterium]